ncbi:uncharacterized protein LOC118419984 [Branchiostoma floridae]|uniref:Uncharacterized protein LOC118419984 n=1 Tax=Branchiostoma floridae TaxID=7739 RepID=A0A9J7LIV6_BRAFL|nr:uncharacterized protein LOC118419984 [Branchiostoma floridae]
MTINDYRNQTANIVAFDESKPNQDYQLWFHQDEGYIVAKATDNMAMALEGDAIGPDVNIINTPRVPNNDYQKWRIVKHGGTLVSISPKLDNSYAMTLKDGSNRPGTEVVLTKIENNIPTGKQLWKFTQ